MMKNCENCLHYYVCPKERVRAITSVGVECCYDYILKLNVKEIVHAKWTKMEDDMCYWYVCSHCGHDIPENRYHNDWFSDWCPNCGARMYTENEDE